MTWLTYYDRDALSGWRKPPTGTQAPNGHGVSPEIHAAARKHADAMATEFNKAAKRINKKVKR